MSTRHDNNQGTHSVFTEARLNSAPNRPGFRLGYTRCGSTPHAAEESRDGLFIVRQLVGNDESATLYFVSTPKAELVRVLREFADELERNA